MLTGPRMTWVFLERVPGSSNAQRPERENKDYNHWLSPVLFHHIRKKLISKSRRNWYKQCLHFHTVLSAKPHTSVDKMASATGPVQGGVYYRMAAICLQVKRCMCRRTAHRRKTGVWLLKWHIVYGSLLCHLARKCSLGRAWLKSVPSYYPECADWQLAAADGRAVIPVITRI